MVYLLLYVPYIYDLDVLQTDRMFPVHLTCSRMAASSRVSMHLVPTSGFCQMQILRSVINQDVFIPARLRGRIGA